MAATEPSPELHASFSSPDAVAPSWAEVLAVVDEASISFLSTVQADGRPHVTPLPVIWHDGAFHFCTGPGEQKHINLSANPACAITTGTPGWKSGLDVVVEGAAERVTDRERLGRLAALWQEQLEWPFEAVEGGFHDPDGGDGIAHVFAVRPAKVLAFGKGEPFSQTRFRFAPQEDPAA